MQSGGGKHLGTTDYTVERAVTIDCTAAELYRFWRELENLPRFMAGIESIRPLEEGRYLWAAESSDGRRLEWVTEILEAEPERLISWASVRGSELSAWGSVRFHPAPGERGTEVHLAERFQPPLSLTLGEWFWNLFGEDPGVRLQEDLRRLQQLLESGELVSIEGQPRGKG
ncbi:MAG: SRPBCC family protein [Desulfuromonadales bacterium]|nr:SRPBCC family protein [Desulfuromonadales bacterium]